MLRSLGVGDDTLSVLLWQTVHNYWTGRSCTYFINIQSCDVNLMIIKIRLRIVL